MIVFASLCLARRQQNLMSTIINYCMVSYECKLLYNLIPAKLCRLATDRTSERSQIVEHDNR